MKIVHSFVLVEFFVLTQVVHMHLSEGIVGSAMIVLEMNFWSLFRRRWKKKDSWTTSL